MSIDPRQELLALIRAPLEESESKKDESGQLARIAKVRQILDEHPRLKSDVEIVKGLLAVTKKNTDPEVLHFRSQLILDRGFSEKEKCLEIASRELSLLKADPDELWRYIEESGCEKLRVTSSGSEAIEYPWGFLQHLLTLRPELASLTDEFSLEMDGGRLSEPKAKLLLCGEYFETLFRTGMKETTDKKLRLEGVTLHGFQELLAAIEGEEFDYSKYSSDFAIADDYFRFSSTRKAPIRIFSQKAWEKHWGNVGSVPHPPKALLEAWNAPCPISNGDERSDGPKMRDTHVVCWVPVSINDAPLTVENIANQAKADIQHERKVGYDENATYGLVPGDKEVDRPITRGYYVALYTGAPLMGGSPFTEQQTHITESFPEYAVPSTREAIVCCFMNYLETGLVILAKGDSVRFTRCTEGFDGYQVAVGAFSKEGLSLLCHDDYHFVGVLPVRRFLTN